MNRIGIMQGRLLPKDKTKLRVFPSETWEQEFEVAKELGFDCIEWLFDRIENPVMQQPSQEKIVALSREIGIVISSICAHFFLYWPLSLISSSRQAVMQSLMTSCHKIGCKIIVVPLSNQKLPTGIILLLAYLAKLNGTTILLEPLASPTVIKHRLALRYDQIKVCYDLGNAVYVGHDPAKGILKLSEWIAEVHIKDRDLHGANVPLGTGLVNFPECFQALKAINYQGDYILETCMGDDPIEMAKRHLDFVRGLLT